MSYTENIELFKKGDESEIVDGYNDVADLMTLKDEVTHWYLWDFVDQSLPDDHYLVQYEKNRLNRFLKLIDQKIKQLKFEQTRRFRREKAVKDFFKAISENTYTFALFLFSFARTARQTSEDTSKSVSSKNSEGSNFRWGWATTCSNTTTNVSSSSQSSRRVLADDIGGYRNDYNKVVCTHFSEKYWSNDNYSSCSGASSGGGGFSASY